ncbi:hypothetical protein Tco_1536192 [Tanacetum coccineum]
MIKNFNLYTDLVDFTDMALPPRDQRHQYLRREVHRVQVFDFGGLSDLIAEGLGSRMLIEHRDAQGQRGSECLLDWDLVCGGFFGYTPSYTLIRDPILRLCHRLIACSTAGRSHAPEKVTVADLFYLRGMDVGSVNIPYLLARYLRLFASGRNQGAMIFGGQFVAHLAEHFGLLTEERL